MGKMEKPKQEDVVTVTVDNQVIQTTTKHRELSEKALKDLQETLIEKGKEISKAVGENWFPCGFATLNVSGNSKFVKWFKRHGKKDQNCNYKRYTFGRIAISRNKYRGGYDIKFNYPSSNPTESQSLNFKRPLYNMFQDLLGLLEVETTLHTRID